MSGFEMKPPRRKATIREIAWAAGVLEGEGYFSSIVQSNSPRREPRVGLHMCDLDVVEQVAKIFGYSRPFRKDPAPRSHKTVYRVEWVGSRAIGIMMTVYQFMGQRRRQRIREVIRAWRAYLPRKHWLAHTWAMEARARSA